jgi:hypothetical protein
MGTKFSALAIGAGAAILAVALCGCPTEWPLPPFDTTGSYEGLWQGQTNEADKAEVQVIEGCPLSLTLEQDLTASYPGDHGVKGTAIVDYSCLVLPAWVGEIPPNTVEVTGILADTGELVLASGGCGPGVCLVLVLAGEGADTDADGAMDTYGGAWSFTILLAGVQPFGVTGTFEVAAVD